MDTAKICEHCGKPLGSKAVQGLCAECFLKVGLGTGPSKSNFVPPVPEVLAPHFPQLEVLELLGKGGMGAVYKARQAALNRFVALKILPPDSASDPAFAERFAREAQAMARLSHSNIVTIHEFGQSGGFFYFVMEFVDGVNLRQMIRAHRLSPREAMAIVPQICEALQYAHDQEIVHRDIKPENVLVDKRGRVKIADFGLARLLGKDPQSEPLTRSAEVMGTPHYMAPEQLEKPLEVDHRADIYSLGVVFYEMLTGELPLGRFPAPSRKVEVDVRLDEIVLRALEKEPQLRYQQASAFRSEVETVAQTRSQPDNRTTQAADRNVFWRGVAIGCSVLLVIAAAVVIPNFIQNRTRTQQSQTTTATPGGPAPAARVESPTNAVPPTNLITHEEWSPSLAPGEKPNPTKILFEAQDLLQQRRYEDSLQRFIWFHNHRNDFNATRYAGSLIQALSDWIELGRRYPKAKAALIEFRDARVRQLAAGEGYSELFSELQLINNALQQEDVTCTVFKRLDTNDPALARQCYRYAQPSLVEKGEYALCMQYIGDPQARFNSMAQSRSAQHQRYDPAFTNADPQIRTIPARVARTPSPGSVTSAPAFHPLPYMPPDMATNMIRSADQYFITETRALIEILVGLGRRTEAANIQRQAVNLLDDARLRSAIADAEERVRRFPSAPSASPVDSPGNDESTGTVATTTNALVVTNSPQDELQALDHASRRPYTLAERVEQFVHGAPVRTNQEFEVFQKSRRSSEGYRIRYNVKRLSLRDPNNTQTNSNSGEVLYLSTSNRFYVQWDSPNATTLHYYGPFDGNPIVSLQLPQPSREDQERDLNSRFDAASSVDSFAERDTAMAGLARDAGSAGLGDLAHKTIDQIVSFAARDRAAEETARELKKAGYRDEAISIAKMITSFPKRDAVMAELAK